MAGSVNKVILVGNLGADPEIRRTRDGSPVCSLRLATSEAWRDRNTGDLREHTEWHRVVIFPEGLCKIAEQHLRKGSKIYIEGQVQTRKWQDQSGRERYSTEVVLQPYKSVLTILDDRRDADDAPRGRGGAGQSGADEGGGGPVNRDRTPGDDIPF